MIQQNPFLALLPLPGDHNGAPEGNQRRPAVPPPQQNQLGEFTETNFLIRNRDGTIQLIFSCFSEFLRLIENANSKTYNLSIRLKEIERKNDMKALRYEVIDEHFYPAFQGCLKKNSVLSVVQDLFKSKFSSPAEFYRRVLSVFLLNTPLPKRFNEFLKGQHFEEGDDILTILLCLCQTFLYKTLNQVDHVSDFYQEVEDYRGKHCVGDPFKLKELWIMNTEEPKVLRLLGKDVQIYSEGCYYKLMKPVSKKSFFNLTRYLRTYLHFEVPERITRNLNYAVYIKLVQEKKIFGKETNQAIFAPGCYFIVDKLTEIPLKKIKAESSEEERKTEDIKKIRIIKFKMVSQPDEGVEKEPIKQVAKDRKEKKKAEIPVEEQETGFNELKTSIFNAPNYDDWNLNY